MRRLTGNTAVRVFVSEATSGCISAEFSRIYIEFRSCIFIGGWTTIVQEDKTLV